MTANPETRTRQERLTRIAELERELELEKLTLPLAVKQFYKFRITKPVQSTCLIYAGSREEAEIRVAQRLGEEYPDGFTLHGAVDVFDADGAATNGAVGSNLLTCLTESEAQEFLADWKEDQKLKPVQLSKRTSALQRDIAGYERRKNAIAAQVAAQRAARQFAG